MEIVKAVRRALPMQISMYSPEGGGKTFSALKFAAGLSPDGRVVIVDTEGGRAGLYADNKNIRKVLPNSYETLEMDQPYHPRRFIEAIDLAENAGYKVCIIDSGSDSWDGVGGCTDIAEKDKQWSNAKKWNKRMMTRAKTSNMHIIWLLKAQEKTKIVDKSRSLSGKQEYIDLGVLPIWEKNNFYPMLLGFSIDPKTHIATAVKCHDDLWHLFREPHLLDKGDGEKLRQWNESGQPVDEHSQLRQRARLAAQVGLQFYAEFFKNHITANDRVALQNCGDHERNKEIAEGADAESAMDPATQPDPVEVEVA